MQTSSLLPFGKRARERERMGGESASVSVTLSQQIVSTALYSKSFCHERTCTCTGKRSTVLKTHPQKTTNDVNHGKQKEKRQIKRVNQLYSTAKDSRSCGSCFAVRGGSSSQRPPFCFVLEQSNARRHDPVRHKKRLDVKQGLRQAPSLNCLKKKKKRHRYTQTCKTNEIC